jgi:exonuclease VII large subunit
LQQILQQIQQQIKQQQQQIQQQQQQQIQEQQQHIQQLLNRHGDSNESPNINHINFCINDAPIVQPLVPAIVQPIVPAIVQPIVPAIVQPIVPPIVPPPIVQPIAPPVAPTYPPTYPPPPPRPLQNLEPIVVPVAAINVNDALQNAPTIPPIPSRLPKSLHELVVQHYEMRLEQYNNSCKAHWPTSIQQAFSKRKFLFNYIHQRAAQMRGGDTIKTKTVSKALQIDQTDRVDLSVDKFLIRIKSTDPNKKQRNIAPGRRRQPPPT